MIDFTGEIGWSHLFCWEEARLYSKDVHTEVIKKWSLWRMFDLAVLQNICYFILVVPRQYGLLRNGNKINY